jgi:dolichol-phosphate mannosyltransferase
MGSDQHTSRLSVVVPVLNEAATLGQILERIRTESTPKEVIVVDDGSTDESPALLDRFAAETPSVRVLRHPRPQGKGRALRTGFAACQGRYVVVQDADLEYDPAEFPRLLQVVESGEAEIAYGSREEMWRRMGRLQRFANWSLTWACNLLYGSRLADIMTCYKLMPLQLLRQIEVESPHFEVECELTAKFLRRGWRIAEVPIHYAPRSRAEGKKIRWTHGVLGLWTLLKYRLR